MNSLKDNKLILIAKINVSLLKLYNLIYRTVKYTMNKMSPVNIVTVSFYSTIMALAAAILPFLL